MLKTKGSLQSFYDENFLEYTSYVVRERAIPALDDGLKPVQRRLLQTLYNMDDGRFHKVANVVGETMKLHPHGDQSIFAALINLANKGFLIDRQGNFGNIFTGDGASAARYIECRLTPLAKETLFNEELTEFVDSYDGRMKEPVTLPSKLPLLLLMGAEGIAVGMATKILPHNFCELLKAMQAVLREEEFALFPDFPQGGLLDASGYEDGNGRVRCRARIEEENEKTIIIRDVPYGTTTQSLTDSIEKAAKQGKIKIVSINDYTAEDVEIEIKLARGVYANETIKGLYAFTDCEVAITPNLTLIKGTDPEVSTVTKVIEHNANKLCADLEKELRFELGHLEDKLHARLLEQLFIEERVYKRIEEETSLKSITQAVHDGLTPYKKEIGREVTDGDIDRLLEIRIKKISRYNIDKHTQEIKDIRKAIKGIKTDLKDMVGYTIHFLDNLLEKYGVEFSRKTELTSFQEVCLRRAALANLNVVYNRDAGFIGTQVKGKDEKNDISLMCSEYDKLFLIFTNGIYKFVSVMDKMYVGKDLHWVGIVKEDEVFNLIYRDGAENLCYVKRFITPSFILEKEYRLFAEHKRSTLLLLSVGEEKFAKINLVHSSRAKINNLEIAFDDYLIKNPSAKGKRVSPRVVRRVSQLAVLSNPEPEKVASLPGLAPQDSGKKNQEKSES